jgi:mobilization protein NikA
LFVQANRAALTLSEYLRRAVSGIRIRSRILTDAISEMNRLGGLQKHCLGQLKMFGNDGEPPHKLNITGIRNHSNRTCGGK